MVGHSKKRRSAIGGVAGKAGSARYGPLFSKPKRPRSEGAPVLDNNNNNHSLDSMSQDSASREIVFDFTSIPLTHAKKSGNFNAGEPVTFGQNNINNNVKSLGNMFNFSQSQNGVSSQSPSKSSELPFPGILSCSPGNNYASVNTPFHLNSLSHLNISAEDSVLCTPQDQPVHSQNDRKLDLDLQNRRNSKNVHTSSPLKLEILPAIQNPFILSSENETDRIANVPEGGPLTQVQGFGRYMSEFVPLERLGGGDFGEVRKCRRKLDGCYYALKRITSTFRGSKELKFQLNEVHALSALKTFPYDGSSNNHGPDELMFFYGLGHIIQYFDSWIEGNQLYILTELCEAGDLYKLYINGSGEDRNSLDINRLLRRLLSQIGAALAVIHYLGLSHLDL